MCVKQSLSYRLSLGSKEKEDLSSACEQVWTERGPSQRACGGEYTAQRGSCCLYLFTIVSESYCLRNRAESSSAVTQLLWTAAAMKVTISHHRGLCCGEGPGWAVVGAGPEKASQMLFISQT